MPTTRDRLVKLAGEPRRIPAAVLRRAFPRSERFGFPWVHLEDGSVTFRERGFVSADSPAALLARHNFELSRIHRELAEVNVDESLEVGCGYGRLSTAIGQHSLRHTAVDINDDVLAVARASYPEITFERASALSLPFESDRFDLVVTWTVLQHVPPDRIAIACTELLRVSAPETTVLICEETAHPSERGGHTWHRTVEAYQLLLAPLELVSSGPIEEIARIPGMQSPGNVMLFRTPTNTAVPTQFDDAPPSPAQH